jgi:tricorn protease
MKIIFFHFPKSILSLIFCLLIGITTSAQGFEGYYQSPDIYGDKIVFSAEGDLWTVPLIGGLAQRLTTHAEEETNPSISPDGRTIAFSASYEGPTEVYTMPIEGGIPTRWTYESSSSRVNSWTPDGKLVYSTISFSKVPDAQLVTIDLKTKQKTRIPLAQASEASYDSSGKTIYFVRPAYHRNVTKRYKGGTARQIWKFSEASTEAVKMTKDYVGESHHPIWSDGRVYFI